MADNNTVILRVQLDEADTEKRLQTLTLDLETTRKAQAALNAERKAGQLTDEQFAQKSVELKNQLRAQSQEYGGLQKNLELYRKAQAGEADSYAATQAALSLSIRQQQLLAGSANNSSEASQVLTQHIAEYRAVLADTDAQQGAFFRNVGNYPKGESIEPLIQRLIQLQEIEKQLPAGSEKAIEAQKQIGFQFGKVNEAAASAGLTQKDVTSKLNDYGERLRPVSAELATLSLQQEEVAKTAGKESEAYTAVGFKIGAARKEIEKVPATLKQVNPAAEAATKALSDTATKGLGLLGEQGERAAGLLGKFKSGTDLLSKGMSTLKGAGETGSLGFKAIAQGIALTGIGLFLIVLTAVVSYFTQTAAGGKILAQVLGALGAVVNVLTSSFAALGEFAVKAATDPKQAFTDLVEFVESRVINSFKGWGVILDGLTHGNIKELANGLAQVATGTEDVVGKTQRYGKQLADAAKAGAALAAEQKALIKARRELEVEDVREQSRVAVLLRLSKERGKTSQEQLDALKEAGRIEAELSEKNIELQKRELAAIVEGIRQKGALKAADLLADKAAKEKEIAQSEASQKEVDAKIRVRQSVFLEEQRQRRLDDNKAYYEAAATQATEGTRQEVAARVAVLEADRRKQLGAIGLTENQRQAIIANSEKQIKDLRENFARTTAQQLAALEQQRLDQQIQQAQAGSTEELGLLRRKLDVQRSVELSADKLTVAQRLLIQEKYEADVLKLERDSLKARALAAYDAELASVNAELTLAQKGTQQETELRVEAINTQLAKELAALDKRQDNTAKAALLRANAEKAIQDTRYTAAQAATEKYLLGERNALDEQRAKGLISEKAYDKAVLAGDVQAANTRVNLARAFGQQTDALDQQLTTAKITRLKAVGEAQKAEQDKHIEQARQLTSDMVGLYLETVSTTGATLEDFSRKALILLIDSAEKAIITAQIEIIAKSFATADSIASFGITGFVRAAAIIAAVGGAAEILKSQLTAPPKQFAQGTVLDGPSHAAGGVQLYGRNGHHYGEAEGGEVVLTKGVWANPLLRPLASQLNMLGGGTPLLPRPYLALGGIMQPIARQQLRGQVAELNSQAIGDAIADSLRKNPAVNRWVDFKQAEKRNTFTDSLGSS